MKSLTMALSACALACAPAAAQAATTFYTDAASFAAAAGAASFESFESLSSATASLAATPVLTITCSATADCLDYTSPFPTDGMKTIGAYGGGLTFLFAEPVRAFGLDVIGFASAGFLSDFRIQIGGGAPTTVYANEFNPSFDRVLFAGFISDTAVSQVTVSGTDLGDFVAYDSLRFGPGPALVTASAPEPATWALMLLGFGAAGALLRRSRRLAAA